MLYNYIHICRMVDHYEELSQEPCDLETWIFRKKLLAYWKEQRNEYLN
jgi:hypothetical protein